MGAPAPHRRAARPDCPPCGRDILQDCERLWRQPAAGVVGYRQAERDRRAEFAGRRIEARVKAAPGTGGMTGRLDSPPAEGRLLSQVTPTQPALSPVRCTGAWVAGPCPQDGARAFFMASAGHAASVAGEQCRVSLALQAPVQAGRLQVQLHLSDGCRSDR